MILIPMGYIGPSNPNTTQRHAVLHLNYLRKEYGALKRWGGLRGHIFGTKWVMELRRDLLNAVLYPERTARKMDRRVRDQGRRDWENALRRGIAWLAHEKAARAEQQRRLRGFDQIAAGRYRR